MSVMPREVCASVVKETRVELRVRIYLDMEQAQTILVDWACRRWPQLECWRDQLELSHDSALDQSTLECEDTEDRPAEEEILR